MVKIHRDLMIMIDYRNGIPIIAVDRKDCFNKISGCPILVPCPKNEQEVVELNEKMLWLESDDGFKASNSYDFEKYMTKYREIKEMVK